MSNITIAPTLRTMSAIYELSREGGPTSVRFRAYVARVEHEWGLVAYNPMAGSAASESVALLLAIDAETLMASTAAHIATQCECDARMTLALVVHSAGMWTDRVATEVDRRVAGKPARVGHGIVSLWSREILQASDVQRESAAETARVMWTLLHGAASSVESVLAREGLAYALAERIVDASPYGGAPSGEERTVVCDALEVLRGSRHQSDIAGVLYGDSVSATMGWTTLGIPDHAGYRWAIERATQCIERVGAARALREGASTN
ncbi:MAG: hypothetical protein ABMA00_05840 [Gemmatimonas sp.]